jgi:hypothetical protein
VAGADAAVVYTFRLVVEFELHGLDFETLDKGLLRRCSGLLDGVVLELKETRDEVESVLIDMQTQRKDSNLRLLACRIRKAGTTYSDDKLRSCQVRDRLDGQKVEINHRSIQLSLGGRDDAGNELLPGRRGHMIEYLKILYAHINRVQSFTRVGREHD